MFISTQTRQFNAFMLFMMHSINRPKRIFMISGPTFHWAAAQKFRSATPEDPYSEGAIAKAREDVRTLVATYDIPLDVVEKARENAYYEGLENHNFRIASKPPAFYQLDFLSEWVRKHRKLN
jgi:hypothetical protein